MKDYVRRAIAALASALANRKQPSPVYDFASGRHYPFSGQVNESSASIYDHTENCHINGGGSNGTFNLYHYGTSSHISFQTNNQSFTGYDYDTGNHFSGTVSGTSVVIYDYEAGLYYNFAS